MEIRERIRNLRKETLKMNQDEFGKAIGISRSNEANIETGRINVTDRVVRDICEKFNINENWLRTGEGNMLAPVSREDEIMQFVANVQGENNVAAKRLLSALAKLNLDDWKVIDKILDNLTNTKKED